MLPAEASLGCNPVNLGSFDLGPSSGDATVIVDGGGSAFNTGSTSQWGSFFDTVNVTYRNGATGTLGRIELALAPVGADTTGTLRVESNADVTSGDLLVASQIGSFASADGEVRVTGTGSTLTQTGASILTLGTASAGDGDLFVESGGTLTGGTGATTVNGAGRINILGGTYNANGNITLNGGLLTRDASGSSISPPARR
jgi:T5SS/PEP-CTERM-associated repeat protein